VRFLIEFIGGEQNSKISSLIKCSENEAKILRHLSKGYVEGTLQSSAYDVLCAVFGVMGVMGIPLDIMSITIAAISIGIGVDDIIHYIHRLKIELRSKNVAESIKASHASIGYAMYYTSFAIILGFSIMVTSNFIPTIYFGLLTDLVMIMMLLGALVLLPTLIKTFYRPRIPR